jgi:diguanylate cyclase (GGDEF)-like protein/PAS domain S-box-containing protein
LLALVIASVTCSTLLMVGHELHQRGAAVQRARVEATLLSRLAAARAERTVRGAPVTPRNAAGVLRAVIPAARDAGAVVRSGYGATLPEAVTFLVVDGRGRVLAEPGATTPRGDSLIAPFPAQSTSGWEQDIRGADGHRRVVAFTPLPRSGDTALWVGAGVDIDALLADQASGLWRSLAGVVLFGLVVSFVAWWVVSVGVLRRVNALLDATRRLGSGDLAARTGLADETGELGALAQQFDEMAGALERQAGERALAEERLRSSEARKSAVLEASLDGIVLLDESGRMVECNGAARRLFGCDGRRCVHHRLTDLFPESLPFDSARFNRPSEVFETSCRRLDQTVFPTEVSIAPIRDVAAFGYFAVTVRDITERKVWERSLETLSYVDELTGLYNRRGFLMFAEHQLKLAARNDQPVVLVGVDVDGLKAINDTFGHPNGDRALVELAKALRSSFRDSDVIGRIGGDEFVVLATESQEAGADQAVERFAMRMAGRNSAGDLPWQLAASVGWVRAHSQEARDLGQLLARVDERMYEQKRRSSAAMGRSLERGRFAGGARIASASLAPLQRAPETGPDVETVPVAGTAATA